MTDEMIEFEAPFEFVISYAIDIRNTLALAGSVTSLIRRVIYV